MDINNIEYIYVDSDDKLRHCLGYLKDCEIVAIDTETTGLDPNTDKIRLIQIADGKNPVAVIDLNCISNEAVEDIKTFLKQDSIKIFHNAKFDIKFLKSHGFEFYTRIFDTMLASQLARTPEGPPSFSLKAIADYYLGLKISKEEQTSDWRGELTHSQIQYSARDAYILIPLREALVRKIKDAKLMEVCKLEFDCLWAVADMELKGIGLDKKAWQQLHSTYLTKQKEISQCINRQLGYGGAQVNMFGSFEDIGINLDSPSQMVKALRKKGINLSTTSHAELIQYVDQYDIIKDFIEYRRVSKAVQGFLSPMLEHINPSTNRIHSNYRQIGAHSGRFSCSSPNIQQIPRAKEFRQCFVPSRGSVFIIADYSQIELRVAAEIANDSTMIDAYRSGQDLHALTASLIANKPLGQITKEERQAAKAVNFGLIYAMGAKGLQAYSKNTYGVDMSLEDAETFRDRFFKAYKGIANWHYKNKNSQDVKQVTTLSGRRCIYSQDLGITALLNTPVQGTAADITKKALGMLAPLMKDLKGNIIATVHDEILLEIPWQFTDKAVKTLKSTMERAGACYLKTVPVVAEASVAYSWAEK